MNLKCLSTHILRTVHVLKFHVIAFVMISLALTTFVFAQSNDTKPLLDENAKPVEGVPLERTLALELEEQLRNIAHELRVDPPVGFGKAEKICIDFLNVDPKSTDKKKQKLVAIDDLKLLAKHKEIVGLSFPAEMEIDDKWMAAIATFPRLQQLGLGVGELSKNRKGLTTAGFKLLADLPIKVASLHGCLSLTDEDMKTIADWEELEELYFTDVPITDRGVYTIRGCHKLRILSIDSSKRPGNDITDRSLPVLQNFKQLEELNLGGTFVTLSGAESIMKTLSKCTVHWGPIDR